MGMTGSFNLDKMLHKNITTVIDAKSADYDTVASLTEVNCQGYTKLMVWYQLSAATWDRACTIKFYGSLWSDSANANETYIELDDATWAVTATDDTAYTGLGRVFIVEDITPYIKVGVDFTTAGSAGTITVNVMPFNS